MEFFFETSEKRLSIESCYTKQKYYHYKELNGDTLFLLRIRVGPVEFLRFFLKT